MSAFGQGSIASYSESSIAKTLVTTGGNAHLLVNSKDRTTQVKNQPYLLTQPYNNFIITGSPILQGAFKTLQVNEVKFPWCIPNVNPYNNSFLIRVPGQIGNELNKITIPEGFYTGVSLASAVQSALLVAYPGSTFTCTYDSLGRFTIYGGAMYEFQLFNTNVLEPPTIYQSLLSVMGFTYVTNPKMASSVQTSKISGIAPLVYTNYVDIVSDVLTQYQDVADSSTSVVSPRHIICRLYISDNTSTAVTDASGNPIYPGMIPFVIQRQFTNSKVIQWNGMNSIDRIDIKLYDDMGNLLYTPSGMPEFQITMRATE